MERLLSSLTSPPSCSYHLVLPSHETSLKIDIDTNLLPPLLGTSYRSTIISTRSDCLVAMVPQSIQFNTIIHLEEHLCYMLTLEIASLLKKNDEEWEIVTPETGSLSRTSKDSNGEMLSLSIRIDIGKNHLSLIWSRRKEADTSVQQGSQRWAKDSMGERPLTDFVRDLVGLSSCIGLAP